MTHECILFGHDAELGNLANGYDIGAFSHVFLMQFSGAVLHTLGSSVRKGSTAFRRYRSLVLHELSTSQTPPRVETPCSPCLRF